MKYSLFFIAFIFLIGCSGEVEKSEQSTRTQDQVNDVDSITPKQDEDIDTTQVSTPKVLIVPCANGYIYNAAHEGDVNPSLEKYLSMDERVIIEPFPYKKMQGAGYFGVYDKKNCASILENTDADFLIMTRMEGGLMPAQLRTDSTTSSDWGYSTRILNTETMEQFEGIRGNKFPSFENIDADVKKKANALVRLILDSYLH